MDFPCKWSIKSLPGKDFPSSKSPIDMKWLIGFAMACMAAGSTQSQEKPRRAPTQQEMDAMKARMQKELDKLTPEQRKKMEEMGISMPTNEQMDEAAKIAGANPQARQGGMPRLNSQKIAAIPKTPTTSELSSFLGGVHRAVQEKLGADLRAQASDLFNDMRKKTKDPGELGKAAVGLWLGGRPELAVLVAGQVCTADATYAENINNYAAMLNMMDAQQMAVPILAHLHQRYPGNPTILNNLGQAWFGLGDMRKAEQYVDSAIRRFPKHSQANVTKSQIQEAKGDKAGAAESLRRSMESGYTEEKEAALRRLSYKESGDVSWPLHIPQDPLGFDHFELPPFPVDVYESEQFLPLWEAFWKKVNRMESQTREDMEKRQAEAMVYEAKAMDARLKQLNTGGINQPGPLSARAARKLSYLLDEKDGGLSAKLERATKEMLSIKDSMVIQDAIRKQRFDEFTKKSLDCGGGEGSSGKGMEQCCRIRNEINSAWLLSTNKLYKEGFEKLLDAYKRLWNAQCYFLQYNMTEPSFEAKKAEYKHLFAAALASARPNFAAPDGNCKKTDNTRKPFEKESLPEFDDVSCTFYSKLELMYITIETRCSRMTTTFDFGELKGSFTEDLNKSTDILPGNIVRGTVDFSIDLGSKDLVKWGPAKVDASAGADVHIEISKEGIKEVTITVGANVTASAKNQGAEIIGSVKGFADHITARHESGRIQAQVPGSGGGGKSISVGGTIGTVTINSGGEVTGTGVLSGLKL
jgi:tetratricopeptide (TPR) repeat protein